MLMMLAQADPAILEQFGANSDMIKKEMERMNKLQELQVNMSSTTCVFCAHSQHDLCPISEVTCGFLQTTPQA